jgi:hypothetical protein
MQILEANNFRKLNYNPNLKATSLRTIMQKLSLAYIEAYVCVRTEKVLSYKFLTLSLQKK